MALKHAALLLALLANPAAAEMTAAQEPLTAAQETAFMTLRDLSQQGKALQGSGDLAGAETLLSAAMAAAWRDFPGNPLTIATTQHDLAAVLTEAGNLPRAESLARAALIRRRDEPRARAASQALLALILCDLERHAEARSLMAQAVESTLADPGADPSQLIPHVAALAVLTARTGDLPGAMGLIGQLEPMLSEMNDADAVATFTALGWLSSRAGRTDHAEAAYRTALSRAASVPPGPGVGPQDQARRLGKLGAMLLQQGRLSEAAALFTQADAMLTGAGVTGGLVRADVLNGLGLALRRQHDPQGALAAQRLALDLRMAALPAGHPQVGAGFADLGETLLRAGDAGNAAAALRRAVAIAAAAGDGLRHARAALGLALAEAALGLPALPRALESRAALAALLPPGHPEAARAGFTTAWLALGAGDAATALSLAQAALEDFTAQAERLGADATIAAAQETDMRRQVLAVTAAAWEVDPAGLIDPAFQAAQWAMASRAARTTQRMSARFAAGSDDLALLARHKQDMVNQWAAEDRDHLELLSRPGAQAQAAATLADADALLAQIAATEADLARRFPNYADLVSPGVLDLAGVQARLTPDEALLLVVTTQDATFAFAVTAGGFGWTRADLPEAALAETVQALRARLDPNAPARSAEAPDPAPGGPAFHRSPAFDRNAAHMLFTRLLAPLDRQLAGKARLLVVADGPLSSLPLQVLVTRPPEGSDSDPAALQATGWLLSRHATTTLPTVGSLAALRDRPPAAAHASRLAGFGDPAFAGTETTPAAVGAFFAGGRAMEAALRGLAPLPGTRRELSGLARALDAPETALHLGAGATERAVKSAPDLAGAEVVAFATHGLLAGEITGLAEPALAFTPPGAPDATDDGLLTASEAAQLTLSASWVILSACNTAADDGTPGAEGLSGLAAGFLHAGARSLLVSHWPVRDDAAAVLTVGAVSRLAADPGLGRAQALRLATLALMQDAAFAQPSSWAPFVLVGDGN
ncbi:CHAT domain-containing tetratricopeptide repeat protein [Paracoccaceae bacterium Fryx2]|nr:CHAT domain-containing tetratricopeptide repeat protein [Paracoccaceae bacterium Fryx2]